MSETMDERGLAEVNGLRFVLGLRGGKVALCRTVREDEEVPESQPESAAFEQAVRELGEYFAGVRREFEIATDVRGSAFETKVWEAIKTVGYGELRSYGDIARAISRPKAVRAVGSAIGRNPAWIFVPCHRIVRSDGSLGGYAGGSSMKRYLLDIERGARKAGSKVAQTDKNS